MGTSTNGILAYGYQLDEEEEWDWESFEWYDEDEDVAGSIKRKLLAAAGFTETDWQVAGYFEREREAEARMGVSVEMHCSGEYPMYILAAHAVSAYRGCPEEIDLAALAQRAADEGWDEKLRGALATLGITPKQDRPRWLLCSYWG